MKTKKLGMWVIALILSITAVSAQTAKVPTTEKVLFSVSMTCDGCKKKIEKNIAFEKGVKALDVNLSKKTVEITFNPQKNTVASLQAAIRKLGYEVSIVSPESSK